MYENAGLKLKKLIHLVTIVGYAIADITGVGAGIWVGSLMKAFSVGVVIQVILGLLVAGVVAGVLMFMVWLANVTLWLYADMSDNVKQIKENMQQKV